MGDSNYSGGKEGSGQPAVIYKAEVDLTTGKKNFEATLIGHSSPDGSDGEIHTDMSGLSPCSAFFIKSRNISIIFVID